MHWLVLISCGKCSTELTLDFCNVNKHQAGELNYLLRFVTIINNHSTKAIQLKSELFEIPIVKLYKVSYFIYVLWY